MFLINMDEGFQIGISHSLWIWWLRIGAFDYVLERFDERDISLKMKTDISFDWWFHSNIFLQKHNKNRSWLQEKIKRKDFLRNDCCWENRKWPIYKRDSSRESYSRTKTSTSSKREKSLDRMHVFFVTNHMDHMVEVDSFHWWGFFVQYRWARIVDLLDRIRSNPQAIQYFKRKKILFC